jgi:hypothetical protein
MAHSFGRLLYHIIYSTKMRHPIIHKSWRDRLYAYKHGIVENLGGVSTAGGVEDHVHLVAELKKDSPWPKPEVQSNPLPRTGYMGAFRRRRFCLQDITPRLQ